MFNSFDSLSFSIGQSNKTHIKPKLDEHSGNVRIYAMMLHLGSDLALGLHQQSLVQQQAQQWVKTWAGAGVGMWR